jgi:hypothetical protein
MNVIARKLTADGKSVLVYEDGDLTQALGFYFRGVRVVRDVTRSLLIANEACLFDAREMPHLIRAANKLARKGQLQPGNLRALAAKLAKVQC